MEKIEYKDLKERERIILEQKNAGKVLIAEQNHIDGNFLVFADEYPEEKPSETIEQLIERKIRKMVKTESLKITSEKV